MMKQLISVACLAASFSFAQTVPVASGRTSVTLSSDFLSALTTLQVRPGVAGQGRLVGAVASFPITQGSVDATNARGEIFHTGGITLDAGTSTRVQLLNFTIDTSGNSPILSGVVLVNGSLVGRIPLFSLRLPAGLTLPLAPRGGAVVDLNGVGVLLSRDAADALNGVFRVTAFVQGFNIGTANVRAILDADAIAN